MAYRVSFFFTMQGDRIGGWSENFWNNAGDINTAYQRAGLLRIALQTAKGDQAFCPRFRISTVGRFRQAITYIIAGAGPRVPITSPTTATANASDYITSKLLIQLNSGPLFTRQWLGGMPDNAVINGGYYNVTGLNQSSLNNLFALLGTTQQGWCLNTLPSPQVYNPITAVDPGTGTVTLPGGASLPVPLPGQLARIRVKGVRGLVYANKLWNVILPGTPTTPPSFVLAGWVPQTTPMTASKAPSWAAQSYGLTSIAGVTVVRSSNHRAGRPTGQVGGRPKKRQTA